MIKTLEVTVNNEDGTSEVVEALLCPEAPGLAITPTWWGFGADAYQQGWTVTHLQSGYAVLVGIATQEIAKEAIKDLQSLGVDWTKGADELFATHDKEALKAKVQAIGLHHHLPQFYGRTWDEMPAKVVG